MKVGKPAFIYINFGFFIHATNQEGMFRVKINGNKEAKVTIKGKEILLEETSIDWDFKKIDEKRYHIIRDDKTYFAELINVDMPSKTLELKINGHIYIAEIKDKHDLLLQQMGMGGSSQQKLNDIKAPMPGLVLNIMIEPGQTIKKGDSIMILEAMKMENILKSPGEGKVKEIKVKKGDAVDKNQVLVAMS